MKSTNKTKIYSPLIGIIILLLGGFLLSLQKKSELISLFPLEHYSQNISDWIDPSDTDYDKTLLTPAQQTIRQAELFAKYFGARSPWSSEYINRVYSKGLGEDLQFAEQKKVASFDNENKSQGTIQYGSNFIPHTKEWITKIKNNMNLQQFSHQIYNPLHRAIAIDNLQGRVLPTNDVSFFSHKIAGQGYPFDNLQASTIWTGTPLYILGETQDHSWSLVHTPNFIAWVKTNGIAIADEEFVKNWQQKAQKQLVAITETQISLIDIEKNAYRFTGYIGMIFPGEKFKNGIRIAIPIVDANRHAQIYHAELSHQEAVLMPFLPTPHHFVELMNRLIGRPYGWGGMYRHSDCSAELKNLFIPFGILLPMHSTNQVDPESFIVKQVDLSEQSMDQRLDYLAKHGHKFMTIGYVGGHVFLYLGNYTNPNNPKEKVILTYQAMWGLKPETADSRMIIGKSALFPLLKSYPENPQLVPQANKTYFQLGYLDPSPEQMVQDNRIDLETYVSP